MRRSLLWGAALFVLVLVSYLPVLRAGYIWDDPDWVIENTALRTPEGLYRIWFVPGAVPHYYPMVFTVFWIEYQLWGLDPAGYHLVNVILHGVNALLLWRLLRKIGIVTYFREKIGDYPYFSWLAAAVFGVHPVHVESVAWVTELKNVLSGALYLSAFLVFTGAVLPDEQAPPPARRRVWYACMAAYALFVLALLSKTVVCTLPVAMLIVLWWKRQRVGLGDFLKVAPMFVVAFALSFFTVRIEGAYLSGRPSELVLSFPERCLIAGRALWFYPAKLIWPFNLCHVYPRWEMDAGDWRQYLFPVLAVAACVALWLARGRIGKGCVAAAAFYVVTISPALGFIDYSSMDFSMVADHFQYLASIGVIALFTGCATRLYGASGQRLRRAGIVAAALLLAGLCLLTWRQCLIYKDEETLWRDTLAKNPDCFSAHNNLGLILMARGEVEEARRHFTKGLEAIGRFRRHWTTYETLGRVLALQGKLDEAADNYRTAVSMNPRSAELRRALALVLTRQGRRDEAETVLREAASIAPRDPMIRNNLAFILSAQGKSAEAASHYRVALDLRPDWPLPMKNLAWILATDPDPAVRNGAEAVELMLRARKNARVEDPETLDVLAAALAETGRFEEAEQTAQRAMDLANAAGKAAWAREIQQRIQLFRERRPFRSTPSRSR